MSNFKCDVCGRFISIADMIGGAATRKLIYPESDLTVETYETLCPKHNNITEEKQHVHE